MYEQSFVHASLLMPQCAPIKKCLPLLPVDCNLDDFSDIPAPGNVHEGSCSLWGGSLKKLTKSRPVLPNFIEDGSTDKWSEVPKWSTKHDFALPDASHSKGPDPQCISHPSSHCIKLFRASASRSPLNCHQANGSSTTSEGSFNDGVADHSRLPCQMSPLELIDAANNAATSDESCYPESSPYSGSLEEISSPIDLDATSNFSIDVDEFSRAYFGEIPSFPTAAIDTSIFSQLQNTTAITPPKFVHGNFSEDVYHTCRTVDSETSHSSQVSKDLNLDTCWTDLESNSNCQAKKIEPILSEKATLPSFAAASNFSSETHRSSRYRKSAELGNKLYGSYQPALVECTPSKSLQPSESRDSEELKLHRLYRVYMAAGGLNLPPDDIVVNHQVMANTLHESVINAMQQNGPIEMASRLQAFLWPVVARGQNAVAIGERRSGKTLGYILPLVSLLLDMWPCIVREASVRAGGVAVVVCKGWRAVQCVGDTFAQLLNPHGLRVLAIWGGLGQGTLNEIMKEVCRGADVLVTTLPFLLRMIGAEQKENAGKGTGNVDLVSQVHLDLLSHCFHLIIDDADVIMDRNATGVKLLLREWACSRDRSKYSHFSQQLVVTASRWTDFIESLSLFLTPLMDPSVIISSPVEAARASHVKSVVHVIATTAHDPRTGSSSSFSAYPALGFAVDLIKEEVTEKKVLVFVQNHHDAKQLRRLLSSVALFARVVHGRLLAWEVQEEVRAWEGSTSGKILIVSASTVSLLLEQDLRDADVLVHVHLPMSKEQFGQRLSFVMDKCVQDFSQDIVDPPVSYVIVDNSTKALPSYLKATLANLRTDLPQELDEAFDDDSQEDGLLCHYLKAYGSCPSVHLCEWRHKMLQEDLSCKLPDSGIVSFEIVKVLNASRYLVRLNEYRKSSSSAPIDLSCVHFTLFMTIQSYCRHDSNLVPYTDVCVGGMCLIHHDSVWARGRILHIHEKSTAKLVGKNSLTKVTLFLVDEGNEVAVDTSQLFKLPDKFALLPQLVVEVYLCNVRPLDDDTDWTHHANLFVEKLFAVCEEPSTSSSSSSREAIVRKFTGSIALSLASTLWISPLVEMVNVQGTNIRNESVRSQLIREGFGCDNSDHINILKELFTSLKHEENSSPSWLSHWTE